MENSVRVIPTQRQFLLLETSNNRRWRSMNTKEERVNVIKEQILKHVRDVEQRHQRLSNTVSHFERLLEKSIESQDVSLIVRDFKKDQTRDESMIDDDLFDQLKELFGFKGEGCSAASTARGKEIHVDPSVTFLDKLHMKQKIDRFLEFEQQHLQREIHTDMQPDQSLHDKNDRMSIDERDEELLFKKLTRHINVNSRNELMKFSLLAERMKVEHPEYYRANDPIYLNEKETLPFDCLLHRLLIDLPRHGEEGMSGCIRTLIKVFNQKFGRMLNVPSMDEVQQLIDEYRANFPKTILYPQPLDLHDNPPFEFLINHYLPQLNQYRIQWRNEWKMRDQLIHFLRLYFSEAGDNESASRWDQPRMSQFPVIIRRNSKFFLLLGIRYTESVNRPKVVWDKSDQTFWNSFPYFDRSGSMPIARSRGTVAAHQHSRIPVHIPQYIYNTYKFWPFNESESNPFGIVFDERAIERRVRDEIMNGESGIIQQLLKYNPIQVLANIKSILSKIGPFSLLIPSPTIAAEHIPDTINLFKSNIQPYLSESIRTQLLSDIERSYKQELEASKRDIFSPASLNITKHGRTSFWKYNHPEMRPKKYIHVIRQQFCRYFPFLSQFFEQLSDYDIVTVKFFIMSPKFREMIGGSSSTTTRFQQRPINVAKVSMEGRIIDVVPTAESQNRKSPHIINHLPSLLQSIRFSMQLRRESKRNFLLFLKGLYIPGTNTHTEYIQHKVKRFLDKEREDKSDFIQYLTLFSRLMNGKWKKPFSYTRITVPTTREVIAKFTIMYRFLMQRMLIDKNDKDENDTETDDISSLEGLETMAFEKNEMKEVVEYIQSQITSNPNLSDVSNIPKRVQVVADRYIVQNGEEIFQRAVILLIDLSISTQKLPVNWRSIVSYFVRRCRADTTRLNQRDVLHILASQLEPAKFLQRSSFSLPELQFQGSKFSVVNVIEALGLLKLPTFLNGPRERYFDQWRLKAVSKYVASMCCVNTPRDISEAWQELSDSKRENLRYIMKSLVPTQSTPPVMPILPNELSTYSDQFFNLHVGDVDKNRKELYQQQQASFRSTLYEGWFEGINYRVVGQYDVQVSNFSLASEKDVMSSISGNNHSDILLLRLLIKRLLRIVHTVTFSGARIKLSNDMKLDISDIVSSISNISIVSLSQEEAVLLNIGKGIALSCDFSDKWFKFVLSQEADISKYLNESDNKLILSGESFLTSLDPFLDGLTTNEDVDFEILDKDKTVRIQQSESVLDDYMKMSTQDFQVNSFPDIGNWDAISNYGKSKTLQGEEVEDLNILSLEEAAFMENKDRPTVYQNRNAPQLPPVELFPHCELLVASGNWSLEELGDDIKFNHPETHPLNRLGSVEQEGVGWMNLDDFIAPGINTHALGERSERDAQDYEWIDNFKYYPGRTLDENRKLFKQERDVKRDLLSITFDDHSLKDRKIRQSVPLWDLEFTFLSARPWQEFS